MIYLQLLLEPSQSNIFFKEKSARIFLKKIHPASGTVAGHGARHHPRLLRPIARRRDPTRRQGAGQRRQGAVADGVVVLEAEALAGRAIAQLLGLDTFFLEKKHRPK